MLLLYAVTSNVIVINIDLLVNDKSIADWVDVL